MLSIFISIERLASKNTATDNLDWLVGWADVRKPIKHRQPMRFLASAHPTGWSISTAIVSHFYWNPLIVNLESATMLSTLISIERWASKNMVTDNLKGPVGWADARKPITTATHALPCVSASYGLVNSVHTYWQAI